MLLLLSASSSHAISTTRPTPSLKTSSSYIDKKANVWVACQYQGYITSVSLATLGRMGFFKSTYVSTDLMSHELGINAFGTGINLRKFVGKTVKIWANAGDGSAGKIRINSIEVVK